MGSLPSRTKRGLCCKGLVDGLSAIKQSESLVMDVSELLGALRALANKHSFRKWRGGDLLHEGDNTSLMLGCEEEEEA
jgi:hypothetical protein